MKKLFPILLLALFAFAATAAEDDATPLTPAQAEAKYTATLEGRAADILKILALTDTSHAAKVHDLIIAQYRALNAWHATNDAAVKAARKDPAATARILGTLLPIHDAFIAGLSANLTPEQVEQVKDKMTYGKVQFTYTGYCNQYPNLSAANKQEILRLLKAAREEAMDAGSAKEKTAVFTRYKGKINNYLSHQGIHRDKAKTTEP